MVALWIMLRNVIVFVALGILYFNKIKEKVSKKFLDLEMVN